MCVCVSEEATLHFGQLTILPPYCSLLLLLLFLFHHPSQSPFAVSRFFILFFLLFVPYLVCFLPLLLLSPSLWDWFSSSLSFSFSSSFCSSSSTSFYIPFLLFLFFPSPPPSSQSTCDLICLPLPPADEASHLLAFS